MTERRRQFLARAPAAAVAVGLTALAGCAADEEADRGSFDGGTPEYARWLYDPTQLLDVDNRLYATFDVASLYENRDLLPAGLFDVFEVLDASLDAVSVPDLGNVTMEAYTLFDTGNWSANPASGLTLAVEGSFDADDIDAELAGMEGVDDGGSHGGYRLHTTAFDWDLGSLGEHTAALTLATSESALVLGLTFDVEREDADPTQAATLAIDAAAGDAPTVAEEFSDASVLLGELGETTFSIGLDVREDYLDNFVDDENEALDAAAETVVGLGLDLDFDGDDLRGDTLVVFTDETSATEAAVECLVASPNQTTLSDASVSQGGRVIRISSRVDAAELWESYWPAVELGGSDTTDGT